MPALLGDQARPIRVIGVGGTIAMRGERAVPAMDAADLAAEIPQLAEVQELRTESPTSVPGPQLTLGQALEIARRARAAAHEGEGVVITTGTDTLEELAVLCAMLHGAGPPIVLTGAIRPGSSPGADGPANLLDAVALAGSTAAKDLGVVVVFGGEIHSATTVRKVDSTGPAAFGSPTVGPLGRVVEGRIWLHARPLRHPPLEVAAIDHHVPIVTAGLGDDGQVLRELGARCDGIVLVALGAGHLSPNALQALKATTAEVPVVITCRPERAAMLFETYGFEGSERDLRHSGAVCAPFLSPQAARVVLLCCLGADLDHGGISQVLATWDAAD